MSTKNSKKRKINQIVNKSSMKKSKGVQESKRNKLWSDEEMTIYAKVLANTDNKDSSWLFQLENYALKKYANEELFINIREEFEEALPYDSVDYTFTTDQLRAKYKWFKKEWRNIDIKIKYGSGLGRNDTATPVWYDILNPHFCDAVEDMTSVSSKASDLEIHSSRSEDEAKSDVDDDGMSAKSLETSFETKESRSDGSEDNVHVSNSPDTFNVDEVKEFQDGEEVTVDKKKKKKKSPKKTSIKFHPRRHSKPKSQSDALLQVAKSIENSSAQQDARLQALIESDRKGDEMFLAYQREQAECNRKHELLMARLLLQQRPPVTNMHIQPVNDRHTFTQDAPLSTAVNTWESLGIIPSENLHAEKHVYHQL